MPQHVCSVHGAQQRPRIAPGAFLSVTSTRCAGLCGAPLAISRGLRYVRRSWAWGLRAALVVRCLMAYDAGSDSSVSVPSPGAAMPRHRLILGALVLSLLLLSSTARASQAPSLTPQMYFPHTQIDSTCGAPPEIPRALGPRR